MPSQNTLPLTPESLIKLINDRDIKQLVQTLAPLTEVERKKLAPACKSHEQELFDRQYMSPAKSSSYIADEENQSRLEFVRITKLALCEPKDISHFDVHFTPFVPGSFHPAVRLLLDRKPKWLESWLLKHMRNEFGNWPFIRAMILASPQSLPKNNDYVSLMLRQALSFPWVDNGSKRSDTPTLNDENLLHDDIWRIFTTHWENRSIETWDTDTPPAWARAFTWYMNKGTLDRSRLLDESLKGAILNTGPLSASWFVKFHGHLSLTPAERLQRQPLYLALLRHPAGTAVDLALNALKSFDDQGALDTHAFILAIPDVFRIKFKGAPLKALRHLRAIISKNPAFTEQTTIAVAHGLSNPAVDVQEAALDFLASEYNPKFTGLTQAISEHQSLLPPSLAPKLKKILASPAPGALPQSTPPPENDDQIAQLILQCQSLPTPLRALTGLDEAISAIQTRAPLKPLAIAPSSAHVLCPLNQLPPGPNDLSELILAISAVIEGGGSLHLFESAVDALSRLADCRQPDFAVQTAPLMRQITKFLARTSSPQFIADEARVPFALLIQSWITDKPMPDDLARYSTPLVRYLHCRMQEVSARLLARHSAPLLAMPTHAPAWVDPAVLVSRLRHYHAASITPDTLDFNQALLRIPLHAESRLQALKQSRNLSGPHADALRFALGADAPHIPDTTTRIAAARARDPWGAFPALFTNPASLGQDAALPAAPAPLIPTLGMPPNQIDAPSPDSRPTSNPPLHHCPTVILHWALSFDHTTPLDIHTRMALWPANLNPSFHSFINLVASRSDRSTSAFMPLHLLYTWMANPDTPMTDAGRMLLCLGLMSKDAALNISAIETLIQAIDDNRTLADDLAPFFPQLIPAQRTIYSGVDHKGDPINPEVVKTLLAMPENDRKIDPKLAPRYLFSSPAPIYFYPQRLAASLTQVARESSLHAHAVCRLISALLPLLQPDLPKDAHHLLKLYLQLLTTLAQTPDENTRAILSPLETKSVSGKVAAAILKLTASPASQSTSNNINALFLQARLARARRWSPA
jgi:hypothetical protein